MKHLLADAINRMPDRERLVLTLYYYEGLTLAEIGERARRHREPGVPDPHEGDPAAARSPGRARARDRPRPLLTDRDDSLAVIAHSARRARAPVRSTTSSGASPCRVVPTTGLPMRTAVACRRRRAVRRPGPRRRGRRRSLAAARGRRRRRRRDDAGGWLRPVDGRGRARRSTRRAPATAPATAASTSPPRRARPCAPPTTASSASPATVAGTLHVDRRARRRAAHVVLVPRRRSPCATGQAVARGDVVGTTGGAGDRPRRHASLHFGLRVGDRYVDPMQLFRPDDLTKLVHLVPADEPDETPWSPAGERRELAVVAAPPDARRGAAVDAPYDRRRRLRHRRPARRRRRRRGVRRRHAGSATTRDAAVDAGHRLPRRDHRPRGRRARRAARVARRTTGRRDARRCRRRAGARARAHAGRARSRSTSSPSGDASPTPSPPTAATTRPRPTAPVAPRTG